MVAIAAVLERSMWTLGRASTDPNVDGPTNVSGGCASELVFATGYIKHYKIINKPREGPSRLTRQKIFLARHELRIQAL